MAPSLSDAEKHAIQKPMRISYTLVFACLCSMSLPVQGAAWEQFFPDASSGVTMDEEAFSQLRHQMAAEANKPLSPEAQSDAGQWRSAMNAATPEERAVLLLVLLSRLNEAFPPAEHVTRYAEALQLHTRALAGDPDACRRLAEALRRGVLPCGLRLPVDPHSAEKLESRSGF